MRKKALSEKFNLIFLPQNKRQYKCLRLKNSKGKGILIFNFVFFWDFLFFSFSFLQITSPRKMYFYLEEGGEERV